MTDLEHRVSYAVQQRENNANDAAAWYAVAQVQKEQIAELEATIERLKTGAT